LCFAGAKRGPTLLKARYAGRAGLVAHVDRELRGLRRNNVAQVARAAEVACNSYQWIKRHVDEDDGDLVRIEELREVLDTFRPTRRQGQQSQKGDYGECATVVLAQSLPYEVIVVAANDDAARRLAHVYGIGTVTTVDILRAMVRDETLKAHEAFALLKQMQPALDPGEVIRSAADLS
jgi:predicted nucleic acid-binding protein